MALPHGPSTRVELENASLLALLRQEFGDSDVITRLQRVGSSVEALTVSRLFSGVRKWAIAVAKQNAEACFLILVDWTVSTSGNGPAIYRLEPSVYSSVGTGHIVRVAADGTVIDETVYNDPKDVTSLRNLVSASKSSKEAATTAFHYHGHSYTVLDAGIVIESNPAVLDKQFPHNRLSAYYRPIAEWDALLNEHFEQCVREAAQTKHWHNKNLRILRRAPEDIFKGSLWWYLNTFVLDALKVKQEYPVDGGGDKPVDICVLLSNGEEYLFEVKWMGKAQGTSEYDQKLGTTVDKHYLMDEKAALAGKDQVINYLKSSHQAVLGCCVVYDGRDNNGEPDWTLCMSHGAAHHRRFYLLSVNPSTEAKRNIAAAKQLKRSAK